MKKRTMIEFPIGGGGSDNCLRQDTTLERIWKKHFRQLFFYYSKFVKAFFTNNVFWVLDHSGNMFDCHRRVGKASAFPPKKKAAFTLAEVLITLGIIGVVATMTLPMLIQNYRKNVLSTRIAKFASIYQQAVRMAEAEHGEMQYWETMQETDDKEITNTGESYLKRYNKYMAKYLKTTSYKVLPDGVAFSLADGSGFIYYYDLKFCVDYKKCLNLIDKSSSEGTFAAKNGLGVDGKNIFLFHSSGKTYGWKWNGTQEDLRNNSQFGCREGNTHPLFCAKLIEANGWKVPDDYPMKL